MGMEIVPLNVSYDEEMEDEHAKVMLAYFIKMYGEHFYLNKNSFHYSIEIKEESNKRFGFTDEDFTQPATWKQVQHILEDKEMKPKKMHHLSIKGKLEMMSFAINRLPKGNFVLPAYPMKESYERLNKADEWITDFMRTFWEPIHRLLNISSETMDHWNNYLDLGFMDMYEEVKQMRSLLAKFNKAANDRPEILRCIGVNQGTKTFLRKKELSPEEKASKRMEKINKAHRSKNENKSRLSEVLDDDDQD